MLSPEHSVQRKKLKPRVIPLPKDNQRSPVNIGEGYVLQHFVFFPKESYCIYFCHSIFFHLPVDHEHWPWSDYSSAMQLEELHCLYCVKWSESRSVMSDSLWPHGLYSPWNSPGQNTGVGSLSLLQGIFPTQGSNPGLPHCRWILYHLSHKGSPVLCGCCIIFWASPTVLGM